MKGLSLSTKATRKLPPTIVLSNSLPASPQGLYTPIRSPMKPPVLKLERLSISRRPSLPLLDNKDGSRTPLKGTFALVKDLQPEHGPDTYAEASNLDVYKEGPVCILPPHLWLYSEPTVDIVRQFDVVINVAEEIKNPFLDHDDNSIATKSEKATSVSREMPNKNIEPETTPTKAHLRTSRDSVSTITSNMYEDTEYIHLPWQHNQTLAADLPEITALMSSRMVDSNKKVLIHCQQGVSRSASLIIAYIMRVKMMDINKAYAFVKERSPGIGPNMSLIYQLCEWGKYLAQSNVTAHRRSYDFSGPKSNPDPALSLRKRATSSADRAVLSRTQSDNIVPTRAGLRPLKQSNETHLRPNRTSQPSEFATPASDDSLPTTASATNVGESEEAAKSPLDVRLRSGIGASKYNLRPRSAQR